MKIGLLVWGVKTKSKINLASWGSKLAFKSKSQNRFVNLRCLNEVPNWLAKLRSQICLLSQSPIIGLLTYEGIKVK